MKQRDYSRLARLSLKARKRTTRQTVVGMSFGLIMLFPLLFIMMAFYGGFTQDINKDVTTRTFYVDYTSTKLNQTNGTVNYCLSSYEPNIVGTSKDNKAISYAPNMTFIDEYISPTFKIDEGKEVQFKTTKRVAFSSFTTCVIDSSDAVDPFLNGDYKVSKNPLVSGKTFTAENSKGEVMVSSAFLSNYDLDASTIVGKKISVTTYTIRSGSIDVSSSRTERWEDKAGLRFSRKIPCFTNYTIVGVFDGEIYSRKSARKIPFKNMSLQPAKDTNVYFWITSDSLDPNGASYPEIIEKMETVSTEVGEQTMYYDWVYYPEHPLTVSKTVTADGYAYFPTGLGIYNLQMLCRTYTTSELIEFDSFDTAKAASAEIDKYYLDSVDPSVENPSINRSAYAPATFTTFLQFYDIFLYVCLILAVLGGVIFIATLLNLINTLHFSIKSMRGFLGICRAEGLRNKGVIRLFLNQILWIFIYSFIGTAIIGSGICVGIMIAFNTSVSSLFEEMSTVAIVLQWYYIPIALAILVGITLIISLVFSLMLAGKTSRTPILDILSEENK